MRVKERTIILAKVRRQIKVLCRRYDYLTKLEYPDCFKVPQREIEKTAIKVYNTVKGIKWEK